jgi:hypothetical protein
MWPQIGSEIEFAKGLRALSAALSYDDELGHRDPPPDQLAPNLDQEGMVLARLDRRDCDKIRIPG